MRREADDALGRCVEFYGVAFIVDYLEGGECRKGEAQGESAESEAEGHVEDLQKGCRRGSRATVESDLEGSFERNCANMIGRLKWKVRQHKYAVGESIEGAQRRLLMLSMRVRVDSTGRIEPRVVQRENALKLDVRPA